MYSAAVRRMELDAEMRSALAKRQFLLHYQPEVRLADRKVAGFERWFVNHPQRGLVPRTSSSPGPRRTG